MASSSSETPRKQFPPLSILNVERRRPRANTAELLGREISPKPDDDPPQPPKPLAYIEDYDIAHYKSGLAYADLTLRQKQRKLSPLGACAVRIYKDACKDLLELEIDRELLEGDAEEAKEALKLEVSMFHRLYVRNVPMKP